MLRHSLVLSVLSGVVLLATPQVRAQSFQHDFRYCVGDYALCAASTCTPRRSLTNWPLSGKVKRGRPGHLPSPS